jgi:hypothetical protein
MFLPGYEDMPRLPQDGVIGAIIETGCGPVKADFIPPRVNLLR